MSILWFGHGKASQDDWFIGGPTDVNMIDGWVADGVISFKIINLKKTPSSDGEIKIYFR